MAGNMTSVTSDHNVTHVAAGQQGIEVIMVGRIPLYIILYYDTPCEQQVMAECNIVILLSVLLWNYCDYWFIQTITI